MDGHSYSWQGRSADIFIRIFPSRALSVDGVNIAGFRASVGEMVAVAVFVGRINGEWAGVSITIGVAGGAGLGVHATIKSANSRSVSRAVEV